MKTRGANELRYLSPLAGNHTPLAILHADQMARQSTIKDDKRHVRSVLESGKLYGPLSPEAQIKAVEYAYGIKMFR